MSDPLQPDDLDAEIGHSQTLVRPSQPDPPASARPGAFQPPPKLGKYNLQKILGRGGMAAVFLAQEEPTGRMVALKLMDPNLSSDPNFVERFVHEAKSCASLHHPNIVEVYAFGEEAGWRYMACEFVEGGTVGSLISAMGHLPPALASELMAQLFAGLAHAHKAGVVHRDLKPENLLLTTGGILKIADFGIARTADGSKLTKTGMLIGTAGYMSPEQAKGLRVDNRSDLFTTGIILYEMLAGMNPFNSDSAATSITRILNQQMPPIFETKPTAPVELELVLDRLLSFDPSGRFATAQDAHDTLLPFIASRRQSQPTLVAECLKRPQDMKEQLDGQAAIALVNEVRGLVDGNALEKNRAAIKLHFAMELDSTNREARTLLEYLMSQMPVSFGPSANQKIAELEATLTLQPNSPPVLTQLAQLYKLEGNILRAAICLKRYLRLKPNDSYTANQLFQLTGDRQRQAGTGLHKPQGETAELMAGVKTGGFKASQRSSNPSLQFPIPQSAVETGVALTPVEAESPLKGQLIKLGVFVGVVLVVVLGIRGMLAKIDKWTADSNAQAEAMMRNHRPSPSSEPGPAFVPPKYDQLSEALFNAAAMEERDGNTEAALLKYETYLTEYPKRPRVSEAKFKRAMLLLELKRNGAARTEFGEFLSRFPGSPHAAEALLRRGQASALNLADDAAQEDFDAFITQHPSSALIIEALLLRGEVRARKKDLAGAKADFEQVIARLAPADPLYERAAAQLKFIP